MVSSIFRSFGNTHMNASAFFLAIDSRFPGRAKKNEPLAKFTTYKIGGPADVFFDARTPEEIVDVVGMAKKYDVPYFLMGGGTNILISDKGLQGLVIKNSSSTIRVVGIRGKKISGEKGLEEVFVETDSGTPMNKIVRFTIEEGLSGLEYHLGLPGTVGGAVAMNSKWMKERSFVGDVVYQGKVLDQNGDVEEWKKEDFHFGYGTSSLADSGKILLSVTFRLVRSDKNALWEVGNQSVQYRRESQPNGQSAGCTYKNISDSDAILYNLPDHTRSVGKLIDMCGLKGKKIGGAMISPTHGNFILNTGGARASDVVELMQCIEKEIQTRFGILITREVKYIGEF